MYWQGIWVKKRHLAELNLNITGMAGKLMLRDLLNSAMSVLAEKGLSLKDVQA